MSKLINKISASYALTIIVSVATTILIVAVGSLFI